jgi:SulP family sulfate permease
MLTVPLTLDTLLLVLPTAIAVAFVGLIETLLTAKLVDTITDSPSSKKRESWGLGVANILSGLWGGVAGCAMIGQTIVNVKIGRARTRLSTVFAGIFLLLFVAVLSNVMAQIPLVALAAVMMIVAIRAVDWHSVRPSTIKRMPPAETAVMVVTVAVVVLTSNLAIGVGVGVVCAALLLLQRASRAFTVTREASPGGDEIHYRVSGALFFASSNDLADHFDIEADATRIIIDLVDSRIWDASSVAALDAVEERFVANGATVEIRGLDERSARLRGRLSGHLNGTD